MLTKADDFPVHQTPEPIAYAGTDRNFYDRYFFNGQNFPLGQGESGETCFFAAALGVYPHLNVMDAAFSVIAGGVQRNLHASRALHSERLDTQVGPIRVEVVEPLHKLRLRVDSPEHGLRAELLFTSRARPIEEPRFQRRIGPRVFMDYTRLTQHGVYDGWIEIGGKRIAVAADRFFGVRDRSWGIRPVGAPDAQPHSPAASPQFYWLWAPLHFDDRVVLYDIAADEEGEGWHESAFVVPADGQADPEPMRSAESRLEFRSGTRHARTATLRFARKNGAEIEIELEPGAHFYMSGLGYFHPEWSHGAYKGELAVAFDELETASVDETVPFYQHIQAIVRARYREGKVEKIGSGVLEQLILGPHRPSGFRELLDFAP
jgi:hypothetical protein